MRDQWLAELDRFCTRIWPRFGRVESRSRAARYVGGLAAGLDRRNGWMIAEHAAGEVSPGGMQWLLRRAELVATRPRMAMVMLQRAVDAGIPVVWVSADEVSGQMKYLRSWLEEQRISTFWRPAATTMFLAGIGVRWCR